MVRADRIDAVIETREAIHNDAFIERIFMVRANRIDNNCYLATFYILWVRNTQISTLEHYGGQNKIYFIQLIDLQTIYIMFL